MTEQSNGAGSGEEPRIVVLGEALIDLVRGSDEPPRSDGKAGPDGRASSAVGGAGVGGLAFRGYPGGSPFNVAIAAARLGVPTAFASQLSSDFLGDQLLAHLRASQVDERWLLRSAAPTTLAIVERQAGVNRYAFHVEHCADGLWDPEPLPRLTDACRFVCHGSFSLLREPAGRRILELVAREAASRIIVLDPNVRPGLIADATDYRRRCRDWYEAVHLLKLSDEDACYLADTGSAGSAIQAVAGDAFARGVRAIVMTRGADGAVLLRPGREPWACQPPAVVTVDTIGAGDTLTAGLMAALDEVAGRGAEALEILPDEAWQDVLAFACTASALNCTRPGADPPSRSEVDRFRAALARPAAGGQVQA